MRHYTFVSDIHLVSCLKVQAFMSPEETSLVTTRLHLHRCEAKYRRYKKTAQGSVQSQADFSATDLDLFGFFLALSSDYWNVVIKQNMHEKRTICEVPACCSHQHRSFKCGVNTHQSQSYPLTHPSQARRGVITAALRVLSGCIYV